MAKAIWRKDGKRGQHMKPILFSTPMVKAILDGRKKCTRRVVKPQPPQFVDYFEKRGDGFKAYMVPGEPCDYPLVKPKYQPGDILWVRETWCTHEDMADVFENQLRPGYYYKANEIGKEWVNDREIVKWRPSIFMPRKAARIFLRVKTVRVERLQEITEEDARAEGRSTKILDDGWKNIGTLTARDENPWVWVYEFERISEKEVERLEGMK